jgi:hypothetical protein
MPLSSITDIGIMAGGQLSIGEHISYLSVRSRDKFVQVGRCTVAADRSWRPFILGIERYGTAISVTRDFLSMRAAQLNPAMLARTADGFGSPCDLDVHIAAYLLNQRLP